MFPIRYDHRYFGGGQYCDININTLFGLYLFFFVSVYKRMEVGIEQNQGGGLRWRRTIPFC